MSVLVNRCACNATFLIVAALLMDCGCNGADEPPIPGPRGPEPGMDDGRVAISNRVEEWLSRDTDGGGANWEEIEQLLRREFSATSNSLRRKLDQHEDDQAACLRILRALIREGARGVAVGDLWAHGDFASRAGPWEAALFAEAWRAGPEQQRALALRKYIEVLLTRVTTANCDPIPLAAIPEHLQSMGVEALLRVLKSNRYPANQRMAVVGLLGDVMLRKDVRAALRGLIGGGVGHERVSETAFRELARFLEAGDDEESLRAHIDLGLRSDNKGIRNAAASIGGALAKRTVGGEIPSAFWCSSDDLGFSPINCDVPEVLDELAEASIAEQESTRIAARWALCGIAWTGEARSLQRVVALRNASRRCSRSEEYPTALCAMRMGVSIGEVDSAVKETRQVHQGPTNTQIVGLKSLLAGGGSGAKEIVDYLQSNDSGVRNAASMGVLREFILRPGRGQSALLAWRDGMLRDEESDCIELKRWIACAQAMGGVSLEDVELLCRRIPTRFDAAREVLENLSPTFMEGLRHEARFADPITREWSIELLADVWARRAGFEELQGIAKAGLQSPDAGVRDATLRLVCRAQTACGDLTPGLERVLARTEDRDAGALAAEALARNPETVDEAQRYALELARNDEWFDAAARILRVADSCREVHPDEVVAMAKPVAKRPANGVRDVVEILATERSMGTEAVPLLIELLRGGVESAHGDRWGEAGEGNVMAAAARALGRSRDMRGVDALVRAVRGEFARGDYDWANYNDPAAVAEIRAAAVRGLGGMKCSNETIDTALRVASNSEYEVVSRAAHEAIAERDR